MSPPYPPLSGQAGTYWPLAVATRGSHALLWRATTEDGTTVAIKVRDPDSGFPREWLEREGTLLGEWTRQGVPGIIPLMEMLDWNGEPALVLPWRPLTLGQLKKSDWPSLRPLLATVAGTLARLHQLGWIHGDVTPGNILLDTEGKSPSLTDFGLAKSLKVVPRSLPAANISATPGFRHPRRPTPGTHTDWHSLAVCAWLLATGTMPPSQATLRQLVHLAKEYQLPEGLAWDLAWWLARGASTRRLRRWLEGKRRRLVPSRYRPWLQPGSWLFPGLIVVAMVLLLVAFWTYLSQPAP